MKAVMHTSDVNCFSKLYQIVAANQNPALTLPRFLVRLFKYLYTGKHFLRPKPTRQGTRESLANHYRLREVGMGSDFPLQR